MSSIFEQDPESFSIPNLTADSTQTADEHYNEEYQMKLWLEFGLQGIAYIIFFVTSTIRFLAIRTYGVDGHRYFSNPMIAKISLCFFISIVNLLPAIISIFTNEKDIYWLAD
jgi:hypothetical protein